MFELALESLVVPQYATQATADLAIKAKKQEHKFRFEARIHMNTDFVNLTTENLASEHLCCIIRSKKPH